ncbi:hypothetical protein SDC9_33545 [bioreactor metagenome]|uniref:Uncharacterized protein n=1 Tax=bioreactor metagenome TaxID=1076179 RepID=A0A644V882_9ZZZZ
MYNFLGKVRKATRSLGNAPFDDEKTISAIEKATEEAKVKYKQLRKVKNRSLEKHKDGVGSSNT